MLRKLITALSLALGLAFAAPLAGVANAETKARHPHPLAWSFNGPLGTFDRAQLQRGFQIYKEVCAACHSMSQLTYRNLGEKGGPFEAAAHRNAETGEIEYKIGAPHDGDRAVDANDNPFVKAIAADYEVEEIDPQTGDVVTRKARPSDRFHNPFKNEGLARGANGGALPPDLSVITKARRGGADYIHALIGGYEAPPPGLEVPPGKYFNPYLHGDLSAFWKGDPAKVPEGGVIAMPQQLFEDRVVYADGTAATVDQMSRDVSAFLTWASDPKLEERKSLGLQVMIYLLVLGVLVYLSYRQVWKSVKH